MPKVNTETKIIRAYCQIILKKPQNAISAVDVYTLANVSRSSFYNYFHNISELEEGVLNFVFDRVSMILYKDMLLQKDVTKEVLYFIYQNRDIYYPLSLYYKNFDKIVTQYIRETILNSGIPNLNRKLENGYGISSKFSLEIYVMTAKTIIITWIEQNFEETPEEIAELIYQSLPF